MNSADDESQSPSSMWKSNKRRWIALILASVGLAVSCFLAWSALTGDSIAGCSEGQLFNCNHVLQSRFAKVLGVPISIPAAFTLLAIIICICFPGRVGQAWHRTVQFVLPLALTVAATSAIWFIWLQFFHIGKLCVFCLTVHICNLILAALFFTVPGNSRNSGSRICIAVAAVALVAILQWNSPEAATFEVQDAPAAEEFEILDLDF